MKVFNRTLAIKSSNSVIQQTLSRKLVQNTFGKVKPRYFKYFSINPVHVPQWFRIQIILSNNQSFGDLSLQIQTRKQFVFKGPSNPSKHKRKCKKLQEIARNRQILA